MNWRSAWNQPKDRDSMRAQNVVRIVVGTAIILAVPLVAMFFTDEVQWTSFDFAMAGALLFAAGLTYEVAASSTRKSRYKIAIGTALAAMLVLIWLHLAVGIIPGVPGGR
jgi:hypothetical protein